MNGVILRRSETPDESYLLKCLMADGSLLTFKIPGIKKSKKRSSYFYSPGTIRDFTWAAQHRDILFVKEDNLLHSPVTENVSYEDLQLITEALFPATYFQPSENLTAFYELYSFAFSRWITVSREIRHSFVNTILVKSLELFGFFYETDICEICGRKNITEGIFLLDTGLICKNCVSSQLISQQLILEQEFTTRYSSFTFENASESLGYYYDQREKIKMYLQQVFR